MCSFFIKLNLHHYMAIIFNSLNMRVNQSKQVDQITRRFFAMPLLHVKSYPSLRAKKRKPKKCA